MRFVSGQNSMTQYPLYIGIEQGKIKPGSRFLRSAPFDISHQCSAGSRHVPVNINKTKENKKPIPAYPEWTPCAKCMFKKPRLPYSQKNKTSVTCPGCP